MRRVTRCSRCNQVLLHGDWPFCNGGHGSVLPRRRTAPDPIVIHRNRKGEIRFPAHADAPVPRGFHKVEVPFDQAHKLEKEVNQKELRKYMEGRRQEAEMLAPHRKERVDEILRRMETMSPEGRAFAEAALKQHRERPDYQSNFDPGFHLEVLHYDGTHRAPQCDETTGWKPRRD